MADAKCHMAENLNHKKQNRELESKRHGQPAVIQISLPIHLLSPLSNEIINRGQWVSCPRKRKNFTSHHVLLIWFNEPNIWSNDDYDLGSTDDAYHNWKHLRLLFPTIGFLWSSDDLILYSRIPIRTTYLTSQLKHIQLLLLTTFKLSLLFVPTQIMHSLKLDPYYNI